MTIRMKSAACLLALAAMSAEASAADLCDPDSAGALKTAAVQQELMVAGLTCNATPQYNRFVLDNRAALQKSDAALMRYFRARDGNEAGYDSYKTKLANLSASRSASEGARYCRDMARDFDAAKGLSLNDFIARDHLLIAAPEACAVKYDLPEVAVAGPSYSLPATPYGGRADPAAQLASNDLPPRPARFQRERDQDDLDNGAAYGPPAGWLLPRPARRGRYSRGGYYDY